jgi:pyruvate/2-oxoglutarate dehydrogenase complex dihydrolipoamide dehydrogenase (E3) component
VPYVAYTDPQFAHVGLHEHEARAKFPDRKIVTAVMPMNYVARALETEESRGAMKAVVDGESGTILGFSCFGAEGGELMSVVQMAMVGKLSYQKLQHAVFAHPTFAESLNNLWGFLR